MAEFTLPPLPYDFAAIEPYIDAKTMEIHHDKHHAAYVTNLNNALKDHPEFLAKPIEQLLADINSVPESARTAVRNNGGGHANHSLFWTLLKPGGSAGEPHGYHRQGDRLRARRIRGVQGSLHQGRDNPFRLGLGLARPRQGRQARRHLAAQSG